MSSIHYGVDLGMRNICITAIETDRYGVQKVRVLTDAGGKREIFNGMQYIGLPDTDTAVDPRALYNKRRLGNSCVRSKQTITMSDNNAAIWMSDLVEMGQTKGSDSLNVPRFVSMVGVLSQVKELINKDIRAACTSTGAINDTRIVFSLSSSLSAVSRNRYRSMIREVFKGFVIDFILSDYALWFNYTDTNSNALKVVTNPEYVMVVDASHSQTLVMVLYVTAAGTSIVHRTSFNVCGKELNFLLVSEVMKQVLQNASSMTNLSSYIFSESSLIEKIKHDLSMFEVCDTSLDIGEQTVRIKIDRNSLEMVAESELQFGMTELISKYSIKNIELAGGFSRSFVIQDILNNIMSKNKNIGVRKAMTSDDAVARGAAMCSVGGLAQQIKLMRLLKQTEDSLLINNSQRHVIGYTNNPMSPNIVTVDASNDKIKIEHCDMTYTVQVVRNVKSVFELTSNQRFDLIVSVDMLDLPVFEKVTSSSNRTIDIPFDVRYGTDPSFDEFQIIRNEYDRIEKKFEKYADLHKRIGDIFNKMEEFYFDKQGYTTKKLSILEEISRLKTSYTYSTNAVDKFQSDHKKLLDAYEFCRIVTVDPDLLDSDTYKRDPEVVVDDRLNRSIIYQLIQEEQGLAMIEQMMRDF